MSFEIGKGAAALPGVQVRYGRGGVFASVEGLAGALRGDGRAPAGGLAPLAQAIDACLRHRRKLRQDVAAAARRHKRARLLLRAASLVVVRLLAWPALRRLQERVREAEFPLHVALRALERCAVPVRAELDPAAEAAYARVESAFDRLAGHVPGLERAAPGPVAMAGRRSLRLPGHGRGESLHLLPGLAFLARPDGAFLPLDPRGLTLAARRQGQSTALAWESAEGAAGVVAVGDAAAAASLAEAFAAYRRELDRLAARGPEAMLPTGIAGGGGAREPGLEIAMMPPQAEHRLPWFPVADIAALGAAALAAVLAAHPGIFRQAIEPSLAALPPASERIGAALDSGEGAVAEQPSAAALTPPRTPPATAASPARAVVRVEVANIRAEPRADATVVGRARRGDRLDALARRDAWVQVGDGQPLGWIREDLVELN